MNNTTLSCFIVLLVVVTIGITCLSSNQSSGITYTEYDIISIDNERFTYIDIDNKIRSVKWCDYSRFVSVYSSNRTYLVIETSPGRLYIHYNLYLNVSDLK